MRHERLACFLCSVDSNLHAKATRLYIGASVNYIVYARYMEWLVDGRMDFIIHKATPLLGRSLPVSIRNRSRKACSKQICK